MIFSDESSVQNKPNNSHGWVFRKSHERFQRELVNFKTHGKAKISIMVWAAIYDTGRSELIIMERDPTAPRGGYSAKSYQNALEAGLLPIYNNSRRFQQDNARIHNFGGTPEWLQLHGIEYIDWPPDSPDLNPIEHVWKALKGKLTEICPELCELRNNETSRSLLAEKLALAWRAVSQELILDLIRSLPRRLKAVIRARGWYTKY